MEIRNNNQTIEKELANIYYKKNIYANWILIMAIAMASFLLYAVFSIAYGKLRSDYLVDVRGMGTVATVSLENGSEEQYQKMVDLSYLTDVGIQKIVAEGNYQRRWSGNLVYVDDVAYEKLQKPAYTDVVGVYPEKEDEIMLSVRCLSQMGLDSAEIGSEIVLDVQFGDSSDTITYTFVISGYYTDYIDSSVSVPQIYVSKAFLEKNNIALFPADKVMAAQSMLQDGISVETLLYADLTMEYDSQQVFTENPMVTQSVEGTFGSIGIAVGCGALVVFCAFMMLYNVVSIAMGKEIRQYGLLKVIGTTNRQLRRIAYRQYLYNIFLGEIMGSMAGIVLVKLFLPFVLQNLFMDGLGRSDVSGFYPLFLVLQLVVVVGMAIFSMGLALRQVMKWNALDSIRYVEPDRSFRRKQIKSLDTLTIPKIAWRNVTRSKKRLQISILSILLGMVLALGAEVVMRGTDITNQLEQNPDFQVGILAGIFRHPEKVPGEINDETQVLSRETVTNIENMDGVEQQSVVVTRGSYALIDFSKDVALEPKKKAMETENVGVEFATIQIVDDTFVEELRDYVKKSDSKVDMGVFSSGEGCILLHHNELSQILEEESQGVIGERIHFYSLDGYGTQIDASSTGDLENQENTDVSGNNANQTNLDAYERGCLTCAGYLDMTDADFPALQMTSIGNGIAYFIMTESAFEKLGFSEKVFEMSFDVDEDERTAVNQKLAQIVQQENLASGEMDTFYLSENYLLLQSEQNKINTANTVLGVMAILILGIGLMNFANTLAANQEARKMELVTMESIGLTRKQLRKMLLMEGMYYWLMIMAELVSIGSLGIWLLGQAISKKLLYFKFVYPWKMLLLLAVVVLVFHVILAQVMYCRDRKRTLTERLRDGMS